MNKNPDANRCPYRLLSCVWELTLACTFSCKYCGSGGGKARLNELNTEECLSIVSQLYDLGCKKVSLIGGEVFLRHDWDLIVGELNKHNIQTSIITNGFLINDKILQRIIDAHIYSIAVSIDGPEYIHDKYRQNGSFKRAIDTLDILTKMNVPTTVITTLNSESVLSLHEIYRILVEYPIKAWQLQACSPMGNAAISGIDYKFDPYIVMEFVAEQQRTAPFVMGVADNIGYYAGKDRYIRGYKEGRSSFRGCRAGLSSIGIDSIGNVRGCESMYDDIFVEGNIRKQPLREIWEAPDAFAYNRKFTYDLLSGGCRECPEGKKCAGGCRSYNFFTHGKMYESSMCKKMGKKQNI